VSHASDKPVEPLVGKVDCIRLYVSDLEQGLAFYCDQLGHALIWRTQEAAGLRLAADESEIVVHTDRGAHSRVHGTDEMPLEVDLKVESAEAAAARFEAAGGKVVVPPFEIQIGRAAVVEDPWGNPLVLLDSSKGHLLTDAEGCVVGVGQQTAPGGYDELYEEALRLAARAHRVQVRKGTDLPYLTHPVHVSAILQRHGFPREAVLAALLHDVIEDQDVGLAEIEARFGAAVAEIVDALSECKSDAAGEARPWHVRKAEAVDHIRLGSNAAAAVKAADVLHNIQSTLYDLRQDGPVVWERFNRGPEQILGYYEQIAALVQAKLGGHLLVREVAAALAELRQVAGLSDQNRAHTRGDL
jgi:predicted enzyme related to lactoylglutathione lyase